MSWSTAEIVRISGVTSRTLRHYDAVGLLRPARTGPGGQRCYGRAELLRLQRILLLRELGLGLAAIGQIVNDGRDPVEQLRRHHRRLLAERDRLDRLATTVAGTISELEGGEEMSEEQIFAGFDPRRQARYEAELVEQYGDCAGAHIAQSKQRTADLTPADGDRIQRQWRELLTSLAELLSAGAAVDDPAVQETIAGHHRWLEQFWTPQRESYTGLGEMYAANPEFRQQLDAVHPALAEFLRDAMAHYARINL